MSKLSGGGYFLTKMTRSDNDIVDSWETEIDGIEVEINLLDNGMIEKIEVLTTDIIYYVPVPLDELKDELEEVKGVRYPTLYEEISKAWFYYQRDK